MDGPQWGPGGPPQKVSVFPKECRQLSDREKAHIEAVNMLAQSLYDLIDLGSPMQSVPQTREKSLAKTNLEQAIMWAIKDVTR